MKPVPLEFSYFLHVPQKPLRHPSSKIRSGVFAFCFFQPERRAQNHNNVRVKKWPLLDKAAPIVINKPCPNQNRGLRTKWWSLRKRPELRSGNQFLKNRGPPSNHC